MLAVFNSSEAEATNIKKNQHTESVNVLKDDFLIKHFKSVHPNTLVFKFESSSLMACSLESNNISKPWSLESRGDVFCMFKGDIDNLDAIKKQMGYMNPISYTTAVIEAHHSKRGCLGVTHSLTMESLTGDFIYLLYDAAGRAGYFAACRDHVVGAGQFGDDTYKLHRGYDSEGNMVLSDEQEIVKTACPNTCETLDRAGFKLMGS